MRSHSGAKTSFAIIAGLSLAGAIAGCSAATDAATDTSTTDTGTDTSTTDSSGTYVDGSYSATGEYQSPGGTEAVEVTVALADNIVTEVTVVGEATEAPSTLHQAEFISGIEAVVVGVNIDELAVDKVGGSSLTSDGFNAAIEVIKADAAA